MKNLKARKIFYDGSKGTQKCAQVFADNYCCTYEHIQKLVAILKSDFPFIADKDIQVQKYGGRRIKGITFVEVFFTKEVEKPECYEEVSQIEYVL